MLEERYKQLERNFEVIVAELKEKPDRNGSLQALLDRLDADLKQSFQRAEASGASSTQRLEERTTILQKNFAAVVGLIEVKPGQETPAAAAEIDNEGSPFSRHPWHVKGAALEEDGAYAAPPKVAALREDSTAEQVITPLHTRVKRYDSFPSHSPGQDAATSPSEAGTHPNGVSEREAALSRHVAEMETVVEKAGIELAAERQEHVRRAEAVTLLTEERMHKWEARQQAL